MSKPLRFGVIGLGHFGTALANHLAEKGHQVLAWTQEPEVIESINQQQQNPYFLSEFKLNKNLKATNNILDINDVDFLLSALPAIALRSVFPQVKINSNAVFISATKGLDPESKQFPIELARDLIPGLKDYAVISGPGFARDLIQQKPAGLVAAAATEETAMAVAEAFSTDFLRVYASCDPIGVELGGTVKNVIAIAAGISDGLGLTESSRAAIITRGLAEIMRLAKALKADPLTLTGLSGLGDLILTATSKQSRNYSLGFYLGEGKELDEALKLVGSTAEGALACKIVCKLAKDYQISVPISESVNRILNKESTAKVVMTELITRPLTKE